MVASEVRKLAERSQNSATEISELSAETVEAAGNAGEMLKSLVPEIGQTAGLVQNISTATREQNDGAEQINTAIHELDEIIQRNTDIAIDAMERSQDLAMQAEDLKETISQFKDRDSIEVPPGDTNARRAA